MANVIDLSVFKDETLDIRLEDGRVVRLTKPAYQIVIELLKFKEIGEQTEPAKVIFALDKMVMNILNSNDCGLAFEYEWVRDKLNTRMKMAIVQSYSTFIAGIQADPN